MQREFQNLLKKIKSLTKLMTPEERDTKNPPRYDFSSLNPVIEDLENNHEKILHHWSINKGDMFAYIDIKQQLVILDNRDHLIQLIAIIPFPNKILKYFSKARKSFYPSVQGDRFIIREQRFSKKMVIWDFRPLLDVLKSEGKTTATKEESTAYSVFHTTKINEIFKKINKGKTNSGSIEFVETSLKDWDREIFAVGQIKFTQKQKKVKGKKKKKNKKEISKSKYNGYLPLYKISISSTNAFYCQTKKTIALQHVNRDPCEISVTVSDSRLLSSQNKKSIMILYIQRDHKNDAVLGKSLDEENIDKGSIKRNSNFYAKYPSFYDSCADIQDRTDDYLKGTIRRLMILDSRTFKMKQNYWTMFPGSSAYDTVIMDLGLKNVIHDDGNSTLICTSNDEHRRFFIFVDQLRRTFGGCMMAPGVQMCGNPNSVFYSNIDYDRKLILSANPQDKGLNIYHTAPDIFRSVTNGLEINEENVFTITANDIAQFRTVPQHNLDKLQTKFMLGVKQGVTTTSVNSCNFRDQSKILAFRMIRKSDYIFEEFVLEDYYRHYRTFKDDQELLANTSCTPELADYLQQLASNKTTKSEKEIIEIIEKLIKFVSTNARLLLDVLKLGEVIQHCANYHLQCKLTEHFKIEECDDDPPEIDVSQESKSEEESEEESEEYYEIESESEEGEYQIDLSDLNYVESIDLEYQFYYDIASYPRDCLALENAK